MTNKYFTPKLEDIRINYICEIPHKEKDDYIKHILTNEDMIRLMGHYQHTNVRVEYLTTEQIESEGWLNKGNNFYKDFWSLSITPTYILTIRFGDEKRFQGKCKDINTLKHICELLDI